MKIRFITKFIFIFLIFGIILPNIVVAVNVDVNGTATADYDIYHKVDRISYFKSQRITDQLDSDGAETAFLKLIVRNNTYDGFNVYLTPTNGLFKAENTYANGTITSAKSDGEADVPYSVTVSKESGAIGTGMTLGYNATGSSTGNGTSSWASSTVINAVSDPTAMQVFRLTATAQTSATDCVVSVKLQLDASHISRLSMAGSYSETLNVTYEDL